MLRELLTHSLHYSKFVELMLYKEIQMMGFRGSLSPINYHYRYLSDGRRGYKSKQKVKEMQKRAAKVMALKREPLVPIRQIAHIVEKSLRARVLDTKEEHLIIS